MSLKEKAAALKLKTAALTLAAKRKDTPMAAKIAAGLAVCYALSPIDLIPDFIPVLGLLDDLLILPCLIALAIRLIPQEILEECETQAAALWENKPKKFRYALPILAVWAALLTIILLKIFVRKT